MTSPNHTATLPPAVTTIPQLLAHAVATHGDATMMRQKELGIWKSFSWRQTHEMVQDLAAGLVQLGLQPGDVVSILSNTRHEWVCVDLAAICAGGVVSGIYPTDAPSQVQYLCSDSGSSLLFVENEEQLDKYLGVAEKLPHIRQVIVFDMEGLQHLKDSRVMGLSQLLALGREHRPRLQASLQERINARKAEDLAILVYTSGTTGRPKGAMLSHANVLAAARTLLAFLPRTPRGDRIAFLPLCHVSERIFGMYYAIAAGQRLNFAESTDTVFDNMREIQPDVFMAVPRVWEKMYSSISMMLREVTPLQRWAYERALTVGQEVARCVEHWQDIPLGLQIKFWLARKLVLNNVRRMMGLEKVEVGVTGAAPISADLIRWYMSLGIQLIELWGMSELSGAATCNPRGRSKPGSIGIPLPGTQVRVSAEGEILVKSPQVFMGYIHQPDKTAETFDDGWLRTGDIGRVDEDGYFYITDRMKDIIITSGGKNITPSEWENQLKFSPYVTDTVVIGDNRAYLSCLVLIDQDNVEAWAQERGIAFSDYGSLARNLEVIQLIAAEIEKVNQSFARVEQIKQFRLIERRLSAEDEELTPTMKLKRALIHQKYRDLIESMYTQPIAA